jgi:hypothetical protein
MDFPIALTPPDRKTRAGRMLALGDVRVTVKDWETDEHITVRFKAILDNREVNGTRPIPAEGRNWIRSPLERATHVFLEVPSAGGDYPDKIGTFYPRTGKFFADRHADADRVEAAVIAAHWLNKDPGLDEDRYDIQEESYCGKCGKTLTDPASIERGIGPECFGKATGSRHQVKNINDMTDADWLELEQDLPPKYDVQRIINLIAELDEQDQLHILREIQMWHSQGRQTLFGSR